MGEEKMLADLSALLFACGRALSETQIQEIMHIDADKTVELLLILQAKLNQLPFLGFELRRHEDEWSFFSKFEQRDVLQNFYKDEYRPDLSSAAYEVLALVAYNQKITRAQIEKIRGVNSDNAINKLLERSLIEVTGNLDTVGRPALFSCTKEFLRQTDLESCDKLPPLDLLMYDNILKLEENKLAEKTEL